jgi:hypothetical protein
MGAAVARHRVVRRSSACPVVSLRCGHPCGHIHQTIAGPHGLDVTGHELRHGAAPLVEVTGLRGDCNAIALGHDPRNGAVGIDDDHAGDVGFDE